MPDHSQHPGGPARPDGPRPRRGLGVVRVRGRSMAPTLRDGDLLLVHWGGRTGVRADLGDVVVVRLPDRPLSVKRLVSRSADEWWVERDNPAEGADSWLLGAVPPDGQEGVVLLRILPRPGRIPPGPDRGRPQDQNG